VPLPKPEPGLVIRYSYLWRREADDGEVAGRKDRPCAVVVAIERNPFGSIVYVVPITHSQPLEPSGGIALSGAAKRRLALDEAPSWVVTSEFNAFVWPGPDLRGIPDAEIPGDFVYGSLPEAITEKVIAQLMANVRVGTIAVVKRTE
jgi:hypothetical protein